MAENPSDDSRLDDDLVFTSDMPQMPPEAKGFSRTDTGNAERLVALHGEDVRYVFPWEKWLLWDGRRWKRDDEGAILQRAKLTARYIARDAIYQPEDELRKGLMEWSLKSESMVRRKALVDLARSEPGIPVDPSDLDNDLMSLTVNNGTLLLETGELVEHDRTILSTKLVPVDWIPRSKCPLWIKFLRRITDGDEDLMAFLKRAVGYSLTGQVKEQCFFTLYGRGANGKSVFVETLSKILGDYSTVADFSTFMVRKSEGPRNDIADLQGARFVSAMETDEGQRLSEAIIKKLTGDDTIKVRFLHKEHFEFVPTFKVWLAANHKPVITGTDHAIWRRVRLIPFTVTIPDEEQDKDLPAKMAEELPGILNWAVEGCLEWQRDGLGESEAVEAATESYRASEDIIGAFISDRCAVESGVREQFSALYTAYRDWASANSETPISNRAFALRLTERGLPGHKDAEGRWRIGVRLA